MNGIKGIDVSEWQGDINWQKVKNAGIKFAMVRTSYGQRSLDKTYIANINGAQAVGINVGAYHYCYAKTVEEAKAEARHFVNTIKPYTLPYPAVLDLEDPSQANLGKTLLTDMAIAFMEVVKDAGYFPMLYANKYWLESKLDCNRLKDYDIWL
ncbi:MAG: glycoside hydrolase family 25 protein, partial [Acutalibacteraceae bacterium]